jgi:hypothetical protein
MPGQRLRVRTERLVAGLEEQHPRGDPPSREVLERRAEVAEELAAPDVDDQCDPVDGRSGHGRELEDPLDQRRREVVDDEAAKVLEDLRRGGSAGA